MYLIKVIITINSIHCSCGQVYLNKRTHAKKVGPAECKRCLRSIQSQWTVISMRKQELPSSREAKLKDQYKS